MHRSLSHSLHGGRIWALARELGRDPASILDFSANLNPLGPPQGVLDVYRHLDPATIAAYPDTDAPELRSMLCERHGAPDPCLVLGHGGASLLMLAIRALQPRRVLVPQPCFREQPRAIGAAGAELVPCPMPGLKTDLDLLKTSHVDAVLLTNPHNPTGTLLERSELMQWVEAHPDVTLVVDEAFMDYEPCQSLLPAILERPRTVILRSLTKFYAMPGIRVGYALADPATALRMTELQEGWPLGQLDILAAQAALRDHAYGKATLEGFAADSEAFAAELGDMGLWYSDSHAPFRLVHFPGRSGVKLSAALAEEGILIRTCDGWPGLTNSHVRLALREQKDRERLLNALQHTMKTP